MAGAESGLPPGAAPADMLAALKARLAEQAQDNPGLAMLLQMMEQRAAAPPAPDDDVIDMPDTAADEPAPGTPPFGPALQADLKTLLEGSASLSAELDTLRQRNDTLAAALGACHLCFGDDAWCPHCGGRGAPGSRRPEPGAFGRYVHPLMLRLRGPTRPADGGGRAASTSPGSAEGLQAGAA